MSFGEELKYVRKQLYLTQAEMAAEMGVTEQTIRRWEHDEVVPRDSAKRKLYALCAKKKIHIQKGDPQ